MIWMDLIGIGKPVFEGFLKGYTVIKGWDGILLTMNYYRRNFPFFKNLEDYNSN